MAGEKGDGIPERKRNQKRPAHEAVNEQGSAAEPSGQAGAPQPSVEAEMPRAATELVETCDRAPCPVVGVGASAGGLEALQGLFDNLPSNPGVAFVVVQHRATDHTSVMKSLVERHTKLTVRDIEDGMKIEPDIIYLAPADKDVSILHGILYLIEPPPRFGVHLPIDSFLRTLAHDEGERAIGIVLSGTGSDGTLGLKEIKAAGGMIMAQEEDQARYDSMPRSAIETGLVDFILPVEKMGEQLGQYVHHPYLAPRKIPEVEDKAEDQIRKIFLLIRNQTGHDFSHYKRNTIRRRIARRLAVHQIEDLGRYIKLLQESPDEADILAREMLITVTNFFRDREAWDSLTEQVLRPLVRQKPPEAPLRIWVAGCATGEEAYTVAVVLSEQMEKDGRHHLLQIFATDLDEESINVGRRGVYPKSIATDVAPARLKRFFTEEGNNYKIKNNLRETIVFARHNLIKDAPFSKLDLVCCRNVLIYLDASLQRRLIPMFHYTLNPGGVLFLGESESIGTFADLFTPVDTRHKIFRRKTMETAYDPGLVDLGYHPPLEVAREKVRAAKPACDAAEVAERVILRDYSLPCVLVDDEFNIVYFNGDTSKYLSQPGGKPTSNILQMARAEIRFKLNLLLKRAFHEKHIALEKGLQIRGNDHYLDADIVVRPVAEAGAGGDLMLVVFQSKPKERRAGEGVPVPTGLPEQEKDGRIRELEQELQSTREYLQTTIEELETSNEELKSSNEELRTVNAEHQQKIGELSKAYDDQQNLLQTTDVATVFLDRELKIRRFTPAARQIFRLIERDVGRPLGDISTTLQCPDLLADIHRVLETPARVDKEVSCDGDEWYQMRVIPYRTTDNVIDGVVITFIAITSLRKTTAAAEQAARFAEAIVETVRQPLLVLDQGLNVVSANPAFCRHFQTRPEETVGSRVYELGNKQWDIPALRRLLEQIVPQNTRFEDFRVQATFPKIGPRTMLLNGRQTTYKGEATGRVLLAFEDITDRAKNPGQTIENG